MPKNNVVKSHLKNLYMKRQMSIDEISRKLHIKAKYWLKKFGIQTRSRSEALKIAHLKGKRTYKITLTDFLKLYEQGFDDGTIADKLKVTPSAISHRRHKLRLPRNPWTTNLLKMERFRLMATKRGKKQWTEKSKKILDAWMVKPQLTPSSALAYLVGFLKGDGYVNLKTGQISAYNTNKTLAESVFQFMKTISLRPRIVTRKPTGFGKRIQYVVHAASKTFCKWFASLSSAEIEKIFKDYMLHFLRGFFDAEGSYGHGICIYNTDHSLLELCRNFLKRIGLEASICLRTKQQNKKDIYYLRVLGGKLATLSFLKIVSPLKVNAVA